MKRKEKATTIEAKEKGDEQVERKEEAISVLDDMLKVILVSAESPPF